MQILPDQTFRNFRASKYANKQDNKMLGSEDLEAIKFVKRSIG